MKIDSSQRCMVVDKRPQVPALKIPFKHLENFPKHEAGQTLEQNPETLRINLQP